jgi:hypothetical protein
MADSEIMFDYVTWTPLELTQHPVGAAKLAARRITGSV